jgi:hypothetical protein
MSNPYFKIGEEVILQSKNLPNLNGEYVVEEVFLDGDVVYSSPKHRITSGGIAYTLFKDIRMEVLSDGEYRRGWAQSALRKKHPPSDDNFEEMMSKLKEGETT